ncbi:MAG: J domain-containing protein [Acidobacteria bacterium]|nr:J domain-containing protein [Acidobacteriota bacterium]
MEYKDYYKILGVPKGATDKEIKGAYRRLARKFHPDMNPGDKQAEARFKEINEANEVLSDPAKHRRYDQMGENWSYFQDAGAAGGWPRGSRVRVDVGGFGGGGGVSDFSDFFRTFFGGAGAGGPSLEDLFGHGRRPVDAEGAEVEHDVELSLEEVLRGATRTLRVAEARSSRRVEVKIPAGVRDGSRVRVAGEGGPGPRGGRRGDLYLRVRVAPHPVFERRGDDLHASVTVPLTTAVLGGEAQVPTLDGPVGIRIPAGTPVGRTFRLKGHGLPRLAGGGGRGDLMTTLSVALPARLSHREKELFEELKRLGV